MNNFGKLINWANRQNWIWILKYAYFYRQNAEYTRMFPKGDTSIMILLDNVACNGNEGNINSCSHLGFGLHNCDHSEDVGVICSKYRTDILYILYVYFTVSPYHHFFKNNLYYLYITQLRCNFAICLYCNLMFKRGNWIQKQF